MAAKKLYLIARDSELNRMISAEQQTKLIRTKKYPATRIEFSQKSNNQNFWVAAVPLDDADGLAIPGLTFQIEYRVALIVDRPKYHFTLFFLDEGKRRRLYQLEVQPHDKKTSHADVPIYGPHEHFMEHDVVRKVDLRISVSHYRKWLDAFCQRANITIEQELSPPFGNNHELPLADK